MRDGNHPHWRNRTTWLVQVHLNCPELLYRQNVPISDLDHRSRRRLIVCCHSCAGVGHAECRTEIWLPFLLYISISCSYLCHHRSYSRICRHFQLCQYRALLRSSVLTIASSMLKTLAQARLKCFSLPQSYHLPLPPPFLLAEASPDFFNLLRAAAFSSAVTFLSAIKAVSVELVAESPLLLLAAICRGGAFGCRQSL